jgi:putative membrane protein
MRLPMILLAGAALVAAGNAQAQSSTAVSKPPSSAPSSMPAPLPNAPTGQAGSAAAPTAPAPATLSRMDQYFIQQAADGGMAEIDAAKLAQQNSSNDQVKQFAQMMIDDHTKANDQLKQIATQKGLAPPSTSTKAEEESSQLKSLKGAAFDRRYAEMQVADHEDTVKLFQDEQTNGSDADLKTFASNTSPTLQQHLDKAKQLSDQVSGTAASGKRHKAGSSASGSSSGR